MTCCNVPTGTFMEWYCTCTLVQSISTETFGYCSISVLCTSKPHFTHLSTFHSIIHSNITWRVKLWPLEAASVLLLWGCGCCKSVDPILKTRQCLNFMCDSIFFSVQYKAKHTNQYKWNWQHPNCGFSCVWSVFLLSIYSNTLSSAVASQELKAHLRDKKLREPAKKSMELMWFNKKLPLLLWCWWDLIDILCGSFGNFIWNTFRVLRWL